MTTHTLIIPDVHGRTFWREAVNEMFNSNARPYIVFLGDYLDPYPHEGITPAEALEVFREILTLKRQRPGQVTLLLGNHDLTYIDRRIGANRADHEHYDEIHQLFMDNMRYFDLAWETHIGEQRFLLSHAGINRFWARHAGLYDTQGNINAGHINSIWHSAADDAPRRLLMEWLREPGLVRSGFRSLKPGSMVWTDAGEFGVAGVTLPDCIQVVGHTQQREEAFGYHTDCEPDFYCLDCRQPFALDTDGTIRYYPDGANVRMKKRTDGHF